MFSMRVIKRDERDQPMLRKYKDVFNFFECPYMEPGDYSLVGFYSLIVFYSFARNIVMSIAVRTL
jgi:hypothetical protein